jgi:hypothetical protein
MERTEAAKRMLAVRHRLTVSDIDPSVRSDGTIFVIGAEVDQFTGQQAFDGVAELVDVFELSEPIEGVSTRALKAPNQPRSPVGPHVHLPVGRRWRAVRVESRVPRVTPYALRADRLYPFLAVDAIEDALQLEAGLRAA